MKKSESRFTGTDAFFQLHTHRERGRESEGHRATFAAQKKLYASSQQKARIPKKLLLQFASLLGAGRGGNLVNDKWSAVLPNCDGGNGGSTTTSETTSDACEVDLGGVAGGGYHHCRFRVGSSSSFSSCVPCAAAAIVTEMKKESLSLRAAASRISPSAAPTSVMIIETRKTTTTKHDRKKAADLDLREDFFEGILKVDCLFSAQCQDFVFGFEENALTSFHEMMKRFFDHVKRSPKKIETLLKAGLLESEGSEAWLKLSEELQQNVEKAERILTDIKNITDQTAVRLGYRQFYLGLLKEQPIINDARGEDDAARGEDDDDDDETAKAAKQLCANLLQLLEPARETYRRLKMESPAEYTTAPEQHEPLSALFDDGRQVLEVPFLKVVGKPLKKMSKFVSQWYLDEFLREQPPERATTNTITTATGGRQGGRQGSLNRSATGPTKVLSLTSSTSGKTSSVRTKAASISTR